MGGILIYRTKAREQENARERERERGTSGTGRNRRVRDRGKGEERLLLKFKSSSPEFTMPSSRRVAEILRLRRFLCLLPCSPPRHPCPVPHILSKRSFRLLVYICI